MVGRGPGQGAVDGRGRLERGIVRDKLTRHDYSDDSEENIDTSDWLHQPKVPRAVVSAVGAPAFNWPETKGDAVFIDLDAHPGNQVVGYLTGCAA